MCFPVRFLERIVKINACLITLLGSLATIIGFTFYFNMSQYLDVPVEGVFYWFSLCILMIAFGSHGLCSKQRQRQCSLICYNAVLICLMLFVLAFIILISFAGVILNNVSAQECLGPQDEGFEPVPSLYSNMTSLAMSTLCRDNCTCYIDPNRFNNIEYFTKENLSYTFNYKDANGNEGNFQTCPYNPLNPFNSTDNQTIISELRYFEVQYECAGWCKASPIYLFTNISYGIPHTEKGCQMFLMNDVDIWIMIAMSISVALLVFLLFLFGFNCCLSCHPDRKRIYGQRVYSYIKYFDER